MSVTIILAFASAIFAGAMAIAVAWYERRAVAHWSFAAGMAVLAIESFCSGMAMDAVFSEAVVYWLNMGMIAMSFLPGIWLLFSLSYARGDHREFRANWRPFLVGAFLLPVGLAVGFHGRLIIAFTQIGSEGQTVLRLGTVGIVLNLIFLLCAVLLLTNLERTFRASVGTMRWRIKFMILGLGVLFTVRAYTSSQALLFRAADLSLEAVNCVALIVACLLIVRALLRAGHFDVNIYPSHSLLHNSFTVLLAGIYLLIVGLFAKVVAFLGGDAAFPAKAFLVLVSLVLLAMLLFSERVRLQTKRFVSRHLQRPVHDYRTVWKSFTECTTSQIEQAELCRAVVKLVSDLFQALSVTVWLIDDQGEGLTACASTSLSQLGSAALGPQGSDSAQVIRAMREHPDPIDIESSTEDWAAVLRRFHPGEFRTGGNRVCVPMLATGEVLGLITLGDRVGGVPFSVQDFDLLKCVADQAAASLLNLRLSHRLMQAKELEAFQTMSAFFVHDLKNTASTLSLMLQNLPVHFDNPAFREDALRAVSKTVTHINGLISRLSSLRQNLNIKPIESDLNVLVLETLNGLNEAPGIESIKELRSLPKIFMDPDQIQKVVTNLALNAREALSLGGTIRIETSQRNSWAVLSVSDNGCGMSREFVSRSLFRPFQTTKKQGIGIGMFQCKMIVEAHHGKIEVETEPGKGSTFRVMLPLQLVTQ